MRGCDKEGERQKRISGRMLEVGDITDFGYTDFQARSALVSMEARIRSVCGWQGSSCLCRNIPRMGLARLEKGEGDFWGDTAAERQRLAESNLGLSSCSHVSPKSVLTKGGHGQSSLQRTSGHSSASCHCPLSPGNKWMKPTGDNVGKWTRGEGGRVGGPRYPANDTKILYPRAWPRVSPN